MADQTEVERIAKKIVAEYWTKEQAYEAGYEAGARAMRERAAKHCDPLDFIIAKDLRSLPLTEGK